MKIFTIILILSSSFLAFSQNAEELEILRKEINQHNRPYYVSLTNNNKGIGGRSLSLIFLFYKNFISSQDIASCSFYPSCSEYALICIRKQNALWGILNSFDRLMRCHSLTPQNYSIDYRLRLQIDPPKNARYEDL